MMLTDAVFFTSMNAVKSHTLDLSRSKKNKKLVVDQWGCLNGCIALMYVLYANKWGEVKRYIDFFVYHINLPVAESQPTSIDLS